MKHGLGRRPHRVGFGLIELLVAIAIVGVLVAITLPAIQSARESARRSECQNKLRQLGIALQSYEGQHRAFPSGKDQRERAWPLLLLPFLEQSALADKSREAFGLDSSAYAHYHPSSTVVGSFVCPSDTRTHHSNFASSNGRPMAHTGYVGVSGVNNSASSGVLYFDSRTTTAAIQDGLSNTLMVGERPPSIDFNFGWWYTGAGQDGSGNADMFLGVAEFTTDPSSVQHYEPSCTGTYAYGPGDLDDYCHVMHYWSLHPAGANFLLADGSVRQVSYGIDKGILEAVSTRDGGEPVSEW